MPFDKTTPVPGGGQVYTPWDLNLKDGERAEAPGVFEAAGASFGTENEIRSYFVSTVRDVAVDEFRRIEPDYNPFQNGDLEGYEDHTDRFLEAFNPTAVEAIKADIDREKEDRKTVEAAGWVGVATDVIASVASPTLLIPGGAFVRAGTAGYAVGRSALSIGIAAGTGAAVQEAGLQVTQQTRELSESAYVIGGSVVLGGLLGAGGAQLFSRQEFKAISKALEDDMIDDTLSPMELGDAVMQRAQAAGAAVVDEINPEDFGVAGPKLAKNLAKATAAVKLNPGLEVLHSPSTEVRSTFLRMAENTIQTEGEAAGRTLGPAAETVVKQYHARQARFARSLQDIYATGRKSGMNLSRDEFKARVAKAARRGDVDTAGDEYITKAAQVLRKEVLEPAKLEAIRVGLLPEGVKVNTATSYLFRVWNVKKIIAEAPAFRQVVRKYLMEEIQRAIAEGKGVDFISRADMEDYADTVTKSIYNNITGVGRGDVPDWIVPAKSGPLKERVFNIRDELVEEFLENDVERISEVFTRKIAPDIELTRTFGSADMADQFQRILDDYDKLIDAVDTSEMRTKLSIRRDRDIKILKAFRDQLRHNYRVDESISEFGQFTRATLAWNYVRLLGGQTISSFADAGGVLTKRGVSGFMQDGLPTLTSKLKSARIARQDARDFVTILETVHAARSASLADLGNPYASGSVADRFMDNITTKFSRLTGINWWNATMKEAVAIQTMNRVAKNIMLASKEIVGKHGQGPIVVNYSKLTKWQRGFMGGMGISDDMAARARTQIVRYGEQENGVWGLNLGAWDDPDAQRIIVAAIQKEVDGTVITPGIADRPLWARSNLGKLIMNFKTHALASHQRVTIARLQGSPRHLAEFMVASTSLGMMIAYLKYIEKGDLEGAERMADNPGLLIAEGIDRAGFIPVLMETSNVVEKLGAPFGIKTGLQAIAGDEDRGADVSRYMTRGKFGTVGGPWIGLFEDLVTVASEASRGDFSKRGVNAMAGLAPGGTLPGVRAGMQQGIKPTLQDVVD
ncbi:hypothetical protein [Roseibium album]|uniref:hypothetical protein n=1 Tax=Roseibium album TaxID=311410 RepID=UPI00248FD2F9|nr:hypothetical protein [Roseibium album]